VNPSGASNKRPLRMKFKMRKLKILTWS